MPCYHPYKALYDKDKRVLVYNKERQARISFGKDLSITNWEIIPVPCNNCIGCIQKNACDWVARLSKEVHNDYDKISFITLTFDNNNLPSDYQDNMHPEYLSTFIAKYRKWCDYKCIKNNIKYYGVPEYGEKRGRLHYHLIVFGEDFMKGKIRQVLNEKNNTHYMTSFLSEMWPYGRCTTDPTIKTSGPGAFYYVANYLKNEDRIRLRYVNEDRGHGTRYYEDFRPKAFNIKRQKLLRVSKNLGEQYFLDNIDMIVNLCYVPIDFRKKVAVPKRWCELLRDNFPDKFEIYKENALKHIKELTVEEMAGQEYYRFERMKDYKQPVHDSVIKPFSYVAEEIELKVA